MNANSGSVLDDGAELASHAEKSVRKISFAGLPWLLFSPSRKTHREKTHQRIISTGSLQNIFSSTFHIGQRYGWCGAWVRFAPYPGPSTGGIRKFAQINDQ